MSKSNKNVAEQIVSETVVTEVTKTEGSKVYVIPMDGSGGAKYIADQGGVSKAIRTLTDLNYTRGEVAKMLNKRYQHVRNVLITPIKKTA
jgi:hypothetical protein